MDVQQMLECLLAAQEQMKADRKADQAKAEAERKADMREMMAEMGANRKADQEMMETQIGSLASKMDTNQARMEESLKEEMRLTVSAIKERMEATGHSIRSERDGKTQDQSENVTERQEIPKEGPAVTRLEFEEQGHKEWESGVERRMVPPEEIAVKSSTTKKRPRGRRVKPTKLTRGDWGSQGKLAAACRKVSRRATVA
jgi:hypothetical protein